MCVLYSTCESGLARPFPRRSDALPCSWSGQTELARGRGLHTETPPIFKMETVSAVLPVTHLSSVLSERATPGVCFVFFPKLVACPLPLSALGMAFIMPFPSHFPKCSLPRPLLGVLVHKNQCVGPGFSFSGRSCEQPRCLKRHFGLMGAARVDSGSRVALCDLSGGSRKEAQCLGSALPEAIWGPNCKALRGCRRPGPASEAGQSRPDVPGQLYAQRPARTPRPVSQLRPRPGPLGRAHRRRGGDRGGGSVPANHMIFPLI